MSFDETAFLKKYGTWALVVGGSEGIGRSFAEKLASLGLNLILLARNRQRLEETANAVRAEYGVAVETDAFDLTAPELEQRLDALAARQNAAGREIGLLVYNAGATHGAALFLDLPKEHAANLVRLNCLGPVLFAHKFASSMRPRQRGGIILLSSMSALAGAGFVAAYAATKSFDLALAEGLWWEMGYDGIDVMSLVAGLTNTPAMARSGMRFITEAEAAEDRRDDTLMVAMEPDAIVQGALQYLGKGPVWFATGQEAAVAMRAAPREALIDTMSRTSADLYGLILPERVVDSTS